MTHRLQSLTRVTSVLLFGRVLGVAFGLINSVVLARVLGIEGLGQYAYAMGLAAMFGLLPNLGLSTVITRAVARIRKGAAGSFASRYERKQSWGLPSSRSFSWWRRYFPINRRLCGRSGSLQLNSCWAPSPGHTWPCSAATPDTIAWQ